MVKFPRRIFALAVFLIIFFNVWYLSQRQFRADLAGGSQNPLAQESVDSYKDHDAHTSDVYTTEKSNKPDKNSNSVSSGNINGLTDSHNENSSSTVENSIFSYNEGMEIIKKALQSMVNIQPGVSKLDIYARKVSDDNAMLASNELPPTSAVLQLYLQIKDEEVKTLKESHRKVMEKLLSSNLPSGCFKGRGIVLTGGGKYFPMVLTAIRWVRKLDDSIPIEVFLKDESEYENDICDQLFPKLNAECRIIKDIYGDSLVETSKSPYALKPLAILASKFDDIYFMDADSYPMSDVNEIFNWDVYKNTGLIMNSDYWPRYISPSYYDVVDVKLGGRARGNENCNVLLQSDRENAIPGNSTESGQIFIRKSSHLKSLLLATYYNVHGPDIYFPLLMQKGPGEGDKDTYAAAAVICNETYYQTQQLPLTMGHNYENKFRGYVMLQPHPIVDYQMFEMKSKVKPRSLALHSHMVKANIKYMVEGYSEVDRGFQPLRKLRFFGKYDHVRRTINSDADVEYDLFSAMTDVACKWVVQDGHIPTDWKDMNVSRYCKILQEHTAWLKSHPDVEAPQDAEFWTDIIN